MLPLIGADINALYQSKVTEAFSSKNSSAFKIEVEHVVFRIDLLREKIGQFHQGQAIDRITYGEYDTALFMLLLLKKYPNDIENQRYT